MASLMRRHQKNKNLGDPRFPSRRVPEYWPDLHEDAVDSRFIVQKTGAGNEARTRDLNLGKVALYQLSYSRVGRAYYGMHRKSQPVCSN